jgi:uncharacterized membrane protein (DUF4010 family)
VVTQINFIEMLVISALVGGLLGVERELKVPAVAGMRTFMLTSILGTLSYFIAATLGLNSFLLLGFFGILLITLLLGVVKNVQLGDVGVTTTVAFLLAFLLGVLVGMGLYLISVSASVVITAILVSKKYLREFSDALTHQELINALEFGLIAFVLYPVMPDQPIDPLGLIHPRLLILVIIVVTTIGFVGFLALRKVGHLRGLPIVGGLGGLVNSSAATSALAIRAKEKRSLLSGALFGVVLANVAMLVRNLILVASIDLDVFWHVLLPWTAMVGAGLLYTSRLKFEPPPEKGEIFMELPFAIYPSIKFAVVFTAITVVLDFVKGYGTGSIYLAAILGGLVSSGAVIGSLVSLAAVGTLAVPLAASACVVSAVGSTFGKLLISVISGPRELTKRLLLPVLAIMAVGLITLLLQGV